MTKTDMGGLAGGQATWDLHALPLRRPCGHFLPCLRAVGQAEEGCPFLRPCSPGMTHFRGGGDNLDNCHYNVGW